MVAEADILKILFPPDGAVPVDRLDEIDLIRSHIDIVIKLSQGFHPTKIIGDYPGAKKINSI